MNCARRQEKDQLVDTAGKVILPQLEGNISNH